MKRAGSIAAVVVAASVAVVAAPAQAAPRCVVRGHAIGGVRHSRVIASRGAVVVYRVRGRASDVVWACRRGGRARGQLGRDDSHQTSGDEYGATTSLGGITLAGDWVLARLETGADNYLACTKYAAGPCPGAGEFLVVVNAATGARLAPASFSADVTDASGTETISAWRGTALSASGAVAWAVSATTNPGRAGAVTADTVSGCRLLGDPRAPACSAQTLAQGPVDAGSLAFSGLTLSWTSGGRPQSAALG